MPASREVATPAGGSYLSLLRELLGSGEAAGAGGKSSCGDGRAPSPPASPPRPPVGAARVGPRVPAGARGWARLPASPRASPRRRPPPGGGTGVVRLLSSLFSRLHPASPFWHVGPPRPHHAPLSAMPPALSFNPHIHHGYRHAGASVAACLRSVGRWHNEAVNIHTHLLPLLAAAAALLGGLHRPWPLAPGAWAAAALPAALCLAGSVTYHTLMPAHGRYATWLALDLAGVFLLFVAGMAPVLWWGFACHPRVRAAFLAAYYGGAGGAVAASLRAASPAARAAPMAGLAAVRAASLVARAALGAGAPAALRHYVAMEALSIGGALVNVARWPERWVDAHRRRAGAPCPGGERHHHPPPHFVDFALNSHNLMHLAVVAALVSFGRGAAAEYDWFHGVHGGGGPSLCAAGPRT